MSTKANRTASARADNVVLRFPTPKPPREADLGAQRMREYGYQVFPLLPDPKQHTPFEGEEFCMVLDIGTVAVEVAEHCASGLLAAWSTYPLETHRAFSLYPTGCKTYFHFALPNGISAPAKDLHIRHGFVICRASRSFIAPGSGAGGVHCREVNPGSELSPAPTWLLQELAKA